MYHFRSSRHHLDIISKKAAEETKCTVLCCRPDVRELSGLVTAAVTARSGPAVTTDDDREHADCRVPPATGRRRHLCCRKEGVDRVLPLAGQRSAMGRMQLSGFGSKVEEVDEARAGRTWDRGLRQLAPAPARGCRRVRPVQGRSGAAFRSEPRPCGWSSSVSAPLLSNCTPYGASRVLHQPISA